MSLSIYMKGDYEEFHALGRRKNKANSKPIISYCVLRKESQGLRSADSVKMRKRNLKKRACPFDVAQGRL